MVTLKIQVPDAEDKSMIERWRYFFGIVSMSLDYIKMNQDELRNAEGTIIYNPIDDIVDEEYRSHIARLYCHRANNESFFVYCNTCTFIIENGKTIDRIN